MPRRFLATLLVLLASGRVSAQPSPHIAPTEPRTPEEQLKLFHLPPGFEIQLVVGDPLIKKPLNIAFDARGRLWVTESVEYPFPVPEGGKARDAVKVLSDFGPDGRARNVNTFADGLNIPIGVLPLTKGALVFSIPHIYSMIDEDGDGKADRRRPLYGPFGFQDTHGMTGEFMMGFDGWVYACHGFANTSKVKGKQPGGITMHSGNTYRFKPDGSRLEYFTHGQVNPFGLTFDPFGNLYSCDCHSRPIYQLLKGAWYPSFEKPHDGLGFGPEMMKHSHESTGIAGIAYYAADQYPEEYRDNVFIGNVITNRINRDRVEWQGATPKAVAMPDFVTCDDPWFRPVDIKLGPDGALYVADFYNRIIGHYEMPLDHPLRDRERGRIWRIVYRGPDGQGKLRPVSDLTKASVAELVEKLNDPNLSVRLCATHELAERDKREVKDALATVMRKGSKFQKAHGLWVLERKDSLDPKTLLEAAKDKQSLVRVHALRVVAERSSWTATDKELARTYALVDDPLVKRVVAEALGAHPTPIFVAHLLIVRRTVPAEDTHLLHVIRIALREQLKLPESWKVVTLMERGVVDADLYDLRLLADVCPGLPSADAGNFLVRHLRRWKEEPHNLVRYAQHIARHADRPGAKEVLAILGEKHGADLGLQAAVFKAVHQGLQARGVGLENPEREWIEALANRLVSSTDAGHVLAGIELAGTLKLEGLQGALVLVAANARAPENQRRAAVTALAAIDVKQHLALLSGLLGNPSQTPELRDQVATALAGTNRPEAHAELLKMLPIAPGRLERTIALGLAGSRQGAEKLLEAVAAGKASARLLQEKAVEVRLRQAKLPDLATRLAKLTRGLPPADARIQDLLNRRRSAFLKAQPDPAIGAKVFEKSCAICHQLNNRGTKIGPQLDGIGSRGLERLLEDILDPNRNIDQAFRATTLSLKNGQVVMGLFLRQEGQVLVMADAQGKEVRVPVEMVDERIVSQLSPMPAALVDQVPEGDFNHLLAYLLSQRATAK
jgi:putative heme-binding domain-containing protein